MNGRRVLEVCEKSPSAGTDGVGLVPCLDVAFRCGTGPRGLTEAMGGSLEPEDTPGGGLTMVATLSAVAGQDPTDLVPGSRERSLDEGDAE